MDSRDREYHPRHPDPEEVFDLAEGATILQGEEALVGGSLFGGGRIFFVKSKGDKVMNQSGGDEVDNLIRLACQAAKPYADDDAAELIALLLHFSRELAARLLSVTDDPDEALVLYLRALDSRLRDITGKKNEADNDERKR